MSQEAVELELGRLTTHERFRRLASDSLASACLQEGYCLFPAELRLPSGLEQQHMSNEDQKNINQEKGKYLTRREYIKYSNGTVACVSLGSLTYGCGSRSTLNYKKENNHEKYYPVRSLYLCSFELHGAVVDRLWKR